MHEAATSDTGPGAAPELQLVVRWAEFTRALAIYPETNKRVRTCLRGMRAALAEVRKQAKGRQDFDPERGLSVLFRSAGMVLGGVEQPIPSASPIAWLQKRIHHAGLAGVEFLYEVTEEGIAAFTRQLLANYLRKDPSLTSETLWPELYDALVLIDRRFDGTFGGVQASGPYTGGHGIAAAAASTRGFLGSLLAHPKVSRRLGRIHTEATRTRVPGEETAPASEMLKLIVDDLPADAMRSRDALIEAVCRVMDGVEDRLGGDDAALPGGVEHERFSTLMRRVSQQHFARKGPGLERLRTADGPVAPGGVRARDAMITDDVKQLLEECDALPPTDHPWLVRDADERAAEQLAVLLHYLVRLERPEELRGLYPSLGRMLRDAGPGALGVLRAYVEDAAGEATPARQKIIRFLVRAKLSWLLRACGALSAEYVVDVFPEHFGLYLGAIDMQRATDVAELHAVCTRLGPDPFLDADEALRAAVATVDGEQIAALLGHADPARLALARLLIAHHPDKKIVEAAAFLQALDPPEEESFLLFQVSDHELMTEAYVVGLIDLHFKRCTREDLQGPVSEVLCRHILATREEDPRGRARLESIRHLARFPSARGWHLLQDLTKRGFGLFGGGEPAAVRRVARNVARDYEAA